MCGLSNFRIYRGAYMNSLVSVIIPVYNMEQFIKTCVDSVISQTYTNIEIILVNDGSTDNSKIICSEIAKSHTNVTLINQENRGVSAARNIGIQAAKRQYLAFLDADDTLLPNAIELLLEAAHEFDADMTIGKISKNEEIPVGVFENNDFLIKTLEDNPIAYYAWRILYKRSFVQGIAFLEGYICSEDSYFVFECALKKPKVVTIKEQVYNYYTNPNSATHSSFTKKKYNDICDLLSKKEEKLSKDYPEFMPLFYHLKTKIQMMLLANLSATNGKEFRTQEKETLERFNEVKRYFREELPYSNTSFYKICSNNMYKPYKLYLKFKKEIRRILKRK